MCHIHVFVVVVLITICYKIYIVTGRRHSPYCNYERIRILSTEFSLFPLSFIHHYLTYPELQLTFKGSSLSGEY